MVLPNLIMINYRLSSKTHRKPSSCPLEFRSDMELTNSCKQDGTTRNLVQPNERDLYLDIIVTDMMLITTLCYRRYISHS